MVIISFAVIGSVGVGKTSLIKKFFDGHHDEFEKSTLNAVVEERRIEIDGEEITVRVWDTAGQEVYSTMAIQVTHTVPGILLVYDITSKESFDAMKKYHDMIDPTKVMLLCGNKLDLAKERDVAYEEGKKFADSNNIPFIESSVVTSVNIEDVFTQLINLIRNIGQPIEGIGLTNTKRRKLACC